ncbi:MAG: 2'-5' RNA ligase [Bacteroidetes bacterium GWA2_31_9b]|nr:MAG: 2'-5' RNA ligase [Bacteroidetes bacterium GWA2_31_9b]
MKRAFIALKISLTKESEKIFIEIKSKLKGEKINWVDNQNMHITLFFLGETEEKQISEIGRKLQDIVREIKPFVFICKGLGVFKNINDPRVIWIGIKKSDDLNFLKQKVDMLMHNFGFEIESHNFKPHLTLGRIKHVKNKAILAELIEKYSEYTFQDVSVNEGIFYESILTSQGAIYKKIQTFKMNAEI